MEKKNEKAIGKLNNEINKLRKMGSENQDPYSCIAMSNEGMNNNILKQSQNLQKSQGKSKDKSSTNLYP